MRAPPAAIEPRWWLVRSTALPRVETKTDASRFESRDPDLRGSVIELRPSPFDIAFAAEFAWSKRRNEPAVDDSSSERRPQRGGGEGEDSEVDSVMLEQRTEPYPRGERSSERTPDREEVCCGT